VITKKDYTLYFKGSRVRIRIFTLLYFYIQWLTFFVRKIHAINVKKEKETSIVYKTKFQHRTSKINDTKEGAVRSTHIS